MLDENVPILVAEELRELGHEAVTIRDFAYRKTDDEAVGDLAEDLEAVLITADRDFQSIAPRIPDGQRRRFRKLSRIWLRCTASRSGERLRKAMSFIEAEHEIALNSRDQRMLLEIGTSYIRPNR